MGAYLAYCAYLRHLERVAESSGGLLPRFWALNGAKAKAERLGELKVQFAFGQPLRLRWEREREMETESKRRPHIAGAFCDLWGLSPASVTYHGTLQNGVH
jgi:hypothetical protein